MIPNEFKILRLQRLVQLTLIVFLIMFPITAPALSNQDQSCNNKNVKLKSFFNQGAEGYLTVVDRAVTIVNNESNPPLLYTINGPSLMKADFYIFDNNTRRFICGGKRGKFVTKRYPMEDGSCLFKEMADRAKHGEIKLAVDGKPLVPKLPHAKRVRHPKKASKKFKSYENFIQICADVTSSYTAVEDLCKQLPPKKRQFAKIRHLVKCRK